MKLEVPFPLIYLPKYVEIEPENKVGFYGEFEVIKKTRGVITQTLKFRNVITDTGLKALAGGTDYWLYQKIKYCQLGTGTTTPVSTDSKLETYGTYKGVSSQATGLGTTNDRYVKVQFEFSLTDAVGTWTELGLSWAYGSGSDVFCRMLFKDDLGNPISVVKTGEDTMTIIYYLHIVRTSDTPTENTVTVDGTGYTVQSLITDYGLASLSTNMTFYNYTLIYSRLGTNTSELSPTVSSCRSPINTDPTLYSYLNYVSGTFYREMMTEFPANVVGNISEYSTMTDSVSSARFVMRFPTPISKTDTTKKIRLQPRITYARV
jgi:hypothetical protein